MGKYMFELVAENIDVLQPHFGKEFDIDLAKQIEEAPTKTYMDYHQMITVPLNGYASGEDYLRTAAPYDRIPTIAKPTMFMNAINDPFLFPTLDYDIFKGNPNTVLATN